jgi:hypothetical protein
VNSDRIFFSRVLPWGDGSAWFNVVFFDDKKPKPFVHSRAYKTIDEMMAGLAWIKRQPYVRDIYACMSSQTVSEQRVSANGFTYMKGVRSIQGAFELKSLFLDIDVKKGAYATTADAFVALKAFMAATGLPRPTIIVLTGGGGLHVHWVLDRALKVAEWLPLAEALKAACKQHGLITDEGVTADAARILRVPDTVNHKYPSKPVAQLGPTVVPNDYPVAYIAGKLAAYTPATTAGVNRPTATIHQFPSGLNSDLSGGMAGDGTFVFDEYEDASKFLLGKGVFGRTKDGGDYHKFLEFLFATAWAATAYPVLRDKLEALFKDTHNAVPDRDPRLADSRWDDEMNRLPGKLLSGAPVITPKTIFKMALDLGWTKPKPPPPPPGTTTDLPPGYTRQPDGKIWGAKVDKLGLSIPFEVAPYPMDHAWLSDEPALNFVTTIRKKVHTIFLLNKDASAKQTMNGALYGQGFMIPPKKVDVFQEFIVAWITHLQTLNRSSHAPAFGWAPGGGFAFAGKVHGTNASAGHADDVVGRHYEPTGGIQPWKDLASRIMGEGRHDLNAIIASAFAGPLVRFTGQEGLLMSACSQDSGAGKTVALRIAASVWGHPIHSTQALDDTHNAVVHKLGQVRNLPVYWDELQTEDHAKKFVAVAFALTGGRGKARMTQQITVRAVGSWETMLVACSNDSIAESFSSVQKSSLAAELRVFEFQVIKRPTTDVGTVSAMVNALKDNHGHAGLEYATYLGSNQAKVEKLVQDAFNKLMVKMNAPAEERFWAATVASLWIGAHIADDQGIISLDVKGLLDFLCAQWARMRTSSTTSEGNIGNIDNLSSVLGRFLRDMRVRHTLHTDRIWASASRPKNGDIKVIQSTNTFVTAKVQIGKQDKQLRVAQVDLGKWMREEGLSNQAYNASFKKAFNMKDRVANIGSGTDYATGQMRCWDFDLSDPAMAAFFDGISLS